MKKISCHILFELFSNPRRIEYFRNYAVIVGLTAFGLFIPFSSPSSAFTIEEAVARGVEANLTVSSQKMMVQEAEKGKMQAYGNFLPTLSYAAQKTRLINDSDGRVFDTDYLDQDKTFQSLRLTQPIFSGFYGKSSVAKAEYVLSYQKAAVENKKLELAYEIRRQFIWYLKVGDDVTRLKKSEDRLNKQLTAAQAFYDRQMAPKLNVMQAEVAVARAHQALNMYKTKQASTQRTLNQLLRLELERSLYSGSLIEMDYEISKTLADYLHDSEFRPDIKMARLNAEISREEEQLIMSQNLPKVNLDVSYNRSDTEYDNTLIYPDQDIKYWSTTLNLSMQFFDGGQTIASSLKQKISTKRFLVDLKELRSKVEMDISNSYASLLEVQSRIKSAASIKEAATRSYERALQRYKVGLGSSVDVLNTQDDVSMAEADIVQARADFQTIKAELDYLTGAGYTQVASSGHAASK